MHEMQQALGTSLAKGVKAARIDYASMLAVA